MAPRFAPARSSRHRTAALALYRALLQSATKIPVAAEGVVQRPTVSTHPVVQVIRKRFAKNKTYGNFRLIFAGMTAGYKFLGLFAKAQTPGSAEHAQILDFLKARPSTLRGARDPSHASSASTTADQPRPPKTPLITKISKPSEPPKYAPTHPPRPKELLKGPRYIPRMVVTAEGVPFLRIKKPQPKLLGHSLYRRNEAYRKAVLALKATQTELTPMAVLEDEWEYLMDEELRKQELQRPSAQPAEEISFGTSYTYSTLVADMWWGLKIDKMWEDWIARGEALHDLVTREMAAAEKDGSEAVPPHWRPEDGAISAAEAYSAAHPTPAESRVPFDTKVEPDNGWVVLPDRERAEEPGGPTPEEIKDPYRARSWQRLVSDHRKRLHKAKEQALGGRNVGF